MGPALKTKMSLRRFSSVRSGVENVDQNGATSMERTRFADRDSDASLLVKETEKAVGGGTSIQAPPLVRSQSRRRQSENVAARPDRSEGDVEEESRQGIVDKMMHWTPRSLSRSRSQASTPTDRSSGRSTHGVAIKGDRPTPAGSQDSYNRTPRAQKTESVISASSSSSKLSQKEKSMDARGSSLRQRSKLTSRASALVSTLSRSGKGEADFSDDSGAIPLQHSVFPDKSEDDTPDTPAHTASESFRSHRSRSRASTRNSAAENAAEVDPVASPMGPRGGSKLKRLASLLVSNEKKDRNSAVVGLDRSPSLRDRNVRGVEHPAVGGAALKQATAETPKAASSSTHLRRGSMSNLKDALKGMTLSRRNSEVGETEQAPALQSAVVAPGGKPGQAAAPEKKAATEAPKAANPSSSLRKGSLSNFKDALKGIQISRRNTHVADAANAASTPAASKTPAADAVQQKGTKAATTAAVAQKESSSKAAGQKNTGKRVVQKAKTTTTTTTTTTTRVKPGAKKTKKAKSGAKETEGKTTSRETRAEAKTKKKAGPLTAVKTESRAKKPSSRSAAAGAGQSSNITSTPRDSQDEVVQVVEDEMSLFPDANRDDDEASFVSVAEIEEREDRGDIDSLGIASPWADREDTLLSERTTDFEGSTDMEDEYGDDDDDEEEESDDDDEGRKLSVGEEEKLRQEREDAQVEKILKHLSVGKGASAGMAKPVVRRQNTNMDLTKKLEISEINSRRSSNAESALVSRYRQRRSQSEDARMKRKSSFNPKVSSTARLLATGLNGDFDSTTMMFGSTDAMLDYIEDSETDDTVYKDPVKRSMKFAACRALIGDLLEESNVYSTQRLDDEEAND